MMLRKALVNDIVHSFCYCCRTGDTTFPVVMLQRTLIDGWKAKTDFDAEPYVIYAFKHTKDYVWVINRVARLAGFMRAFSQQERMYAQSLMERYYRES